MLCDSVRIPRQGNVRKRCVFEQEFVRRSRCKRRNPRQACRNHEMCEGVRVYVDNVSELNRRQAQMMRCPDK